MLLNLPRKRHTEDDDSAPRDYTFVGSVAEGARHRQSMPIHPPTPEKQADPAETPPPKQNASYRIPRAEDGPPPVSSVAYPRPRSNGFARSQTWTPRPPETLQAAEATVPAPQTPRTAETTVPVRRTRRSVPSENAAVTPTRPSAEAASAGQPPENTFTMESGRYAPPPAQEIPDWLQTARQNKTVSRHMRPPQVTPAPQATEPARDMLGRPLARTPQTYASRADAYADAGYPPELIDQLREEEAQAALLQGYVHKRHGAQVQQRSQAAPVRPPASSSYPPPREAWTREQTQQPSAAPYVRYAPAAVPPPKTPAEPPEARQNPYFALTPEASPYQVIQEEKPRRQRKTRAPAEETPDAQGDDDTPRRPGFPFLGLAVFLAALLAIGLYVLQFTYTDQRTAVLDARVALQQKQLDSHPYSYRALIEQQAEQNNLQPAFVAAIVLNESSFNPNAESSVGARGLMQMMEDTAEWVHGKIDADSDYSFDRMYDPETNVTYACWYLSFLCDRFHGDPVLVSAAFHAGQNTVQNWLNDSRYSDDSQTIALSNMAEGPTKNYATRVLNAYAIYKRLYYEGGADALAAAAT